MIALALDTSGPVGMIGFGAAYVVLALLFVPGAALTMVAGAVFSFLGFTHAGHLSPAGGVYDIRPGSGSQWAIGYLMCAGFFALTGMWAVRSGQGPRE